VDQIENTVALAGYDVVVLSMGGNDAQRFDGAFDIGSDEWAAEYDRRVDAMFAALEDGPLVIWVGMPPVIPANIKPAIVAANIVTAAAASRWPHVEYVDAFSLFAGADGGFVSALPDAQGQLTTVRTADGVHYTPTAGVWLSDQVIDVVARRMSSPETLFG
jgi:hypothetical protein